MPSLIDIGDLTEKVEIRGKQLEVQGISAEGIMHLLAKFPDLRKVVTGNADEEALKNLSEKVPEAVAAILAHGTGSPGDEKAEAQARKLAVGEQVTLIAVIWRLTFPKGVKDFLDALTRHADEVVGEHGKDQDTKSPEQLKSA
mgnify:CR=1 FL=1